MKYYPIHTHLHCSHEASASIGSHMSFAKALEIRYMWITEHDTRIGKPRGQYFSFFFSEPSLYIRMPNGRVAGFQEKEASNGACEFVETEKEIRLRIFADENESETLFFHSKGKVHSDPLCAYVTVELTADIIKRERGGVCVEFILSAQPPTYRQALLCYVLGDMPKKEEGEPVQYLPFPKQKNGKYVFPLSRDICEGIGGLDNALCNFNVRVTNGAQMLLHGVDIYRELEYQKMRQAQRELAEKIGRKWDVTAFVGFEVTRAGNHKNCYSTKAPLIEYARFENNVSNTQAIEHLQRHGAVYSWNHPLAGHYEASKTKEEILETIACELIENRVYGASLIEVGFPYGRGNFEAEYYLRLWDRLSENGILITGNGDSDNHHALSEGWTEGNNFCSFAGLYENELPTEENFIKAFKRGTLWSGNPVVIKNLSFTANGKEQGSLIRGEQVCVEFIATDIKCGGYAVCISNGKEIARREIQNGAVSGKWILSCERKYNFARLEIYNEENVLIAFSNPIYLVEESTTIEERA